MVPVAMVVLTAAGVWVVARTLTGSKNVPPPAFVVAWVAILLWNGYWWLTRIAWRLEIEGGALVWRSWLRSGMVPLAELTTVRPSRVGSNLEVFEHSMGRPVLVLTGKGLRRFLDDVSAARPDVPVRLGWQGRLAERWPGWSGWRGRGE